MTATPILHISIPVEDLEASANYYETVLGCARGRSTDSFVDVWFFGAQLTLVRHDDPGVVRSASGYAPHFGAIVTPNVLAEVWDRLQGGSRSRVIAPLTSSGVGSELEQTKVLFSDPDGHAIELKSYVDTERALAVDPGTLQPTQVCP